MTDAEKIQKIVEFMGGWPEHIRPKLFGNCSRPCSNYVRPDERCYGFNPFTRIEDAFLLVERLSPHDSFSVVETARTRLIYNEASLTTIAFTRALAEAAWQVIERLSQT